MYNMNHRTSFLTVRLPQQTHTEFRIKAERYGGVSEVLRELVSAFIDNRLTVTPPVTPRKESLYDHRSKA
jgi:Arc/MetJ-type ribon-helix-helix transcriptional regulator